MIRDDVLKKLRGIYTELTPAEKAVATVIAKCPTKVTQLDITRSEPFLGAHPQFEAYKNEQTTTRRVRDLIHELRVKYHIAIVSDSKGYWIPNTIEEAEDYIDRAERQARSAAKSFMVTFHAMNKAVGGLKERPTLFDFEDDCEECEAVGGDCGRHG